MFPAIYCNFSLLCTHNFSSSFWYHYLLISHLEWVLLVALWVDPLWSLFFACFPSAILKNYMSIIAEIWTANTFMINSNLWTADSCDIVRTCSSKELTVICQNALNCFCLISACLDCILLYLFIVIQVYLDCKFSLWSTVLHVYLHCNLLSE